MSADVDKLNWSGCGMSTGRSPAGIWTYYIIWFCLPLPVAGIFSLSSVMDDHPSLCLNNSSDGDFAKSKGASISLWTICCSFVHALSIYSSIPLWMKVLRSESPNSPHSRCYAAGSASRRYIQQIFSLLPESLSDAWGPFPLLLRASPIPWQTAPVPSLLCCSILNLHPLASPLGPPHNVRALRCGAQIYPQQPETCITLALIPAWS